MTKGRFIVFEGLDKCGKTSVINRIIKSTPENYLYNKGLVLARTKYAWGWAFSLDLIYQTQSIIRPALHDGKTLMQDRYWMSVASYLPGGDRWHNQTVQKMTRPFMIEPDCYLYLTTSLEERLHRLSQDLKNPYHLMLYQDHGLIRRREEQLDHIYNSLTCPKHIIDTSEKTIEETVETIRNLRVDGLMRRTNE